MKGGYQPGRLAAVVGRQVSFQPPVLLAPLLPLGIRPQHQYVASCSQEGSAHQISMRQSNQPKPTLEALSRRAMHVSSLSQAFLVSKEDVRARENGTSRAVSNNEGLNCHVITSHMAPSLSVKVGRKTERLCSPARSKE